ncbi:MAG: M64 family metallopeptidase [Fibrobacterales bacterium]
MFTHNFSKNYRHTNTTILTTTLLFLLTTQLLFAENRITQVDTLLWNGDPMTHIQLVITNDGYTENELEQWTKDLHTPCADLSESSHCGKARQAFDKIFTTSPFKEYKDFFNVIVITTESNQSGIGAENESDFDSFYSVYENEYRGITHNNSSTMDQAISTHAQGARGVVVISNFNNRAFGFSDGIFTYQSTGFSFPGVVVHELGHTIGTLTDSYKFANVYESHNVTKDSIASNAPWSQWIGTTYNNGNDTVGIYNKMGILYTKFYRPCQTDIMNNSLDNIFCPPTQEVIINRFHMMTFNLIDEFNPALGTKQITSPSTLFSGHVKSPNPNTMKVTWTLNNTIISNYQESLISICVDQINIGNNILRMKAIDTTNALKGSYRWGLTYTWTLQYSGGLNPDDCTQSVSSSSIIESSSIEIPVSSSGEIVESSSEINISSSEIAESSSEIIISSSEIVESSSETIISSSEIVESSSEISISSSAIVESSSEINISSSEIAESSSETIISSSEIVESSSETIISSSTIAESNSSSITQLSSNTVSGSSTEYRFIDEEPVEEFIPFVPPPPQYSSSNALDSTLSSSSMEIEMSSSMIVSPAPPEETAVIIQQSSKHRYPATLFTGKQLHREITAPAGATMLTLLNLNGTHVRTTSTQNPNLRGISESRVYIITFQ